MLHTFRSIVFQEDTGAEPRGPLVEDTSTETMIAVLVLAVVLTATLFNPF